MSPTKDPEECITSLLEGTMSKLERMYIREYLEGKGHQIRDLPKLPCEKARQLMTEACIFASGKLAEIEARAKFRDEIHFTP
jgi:hypothetical protein